MTVRLGTLLGALLTGVFATNAVNDALKGAAGQTLPLGVVDGNAGQVINQLIAIAIAAGLAVVGTLIALKVSDMLCTVRLDNREERSGLDISMHGEEGYNFEG